MDQDGEPPALPPLPLLLAAQADLIRAQLEDAPGPPSEALLRYVDAAVLNLCEHVEVDMPILNRVMAMRAAAEHLAQVREDPYAADDAPDLALARARNELAALELALAAARPSAVTVALGLGW